MALIVHFCVFLLLDSSQQLFYLIVVFHPFRHNPRCGCELGLLRLWVVTQVYRLGSDFGGVIAPCLTPKPLLWEGLDDHLVDHVVRKVLVQVGQTVGVLAQGLVLPS